MGKKYDFDYIVIGSGPAGRTSALNLAKAKKKVALVEGSVFGGADLSLRDLPYLSSLDFAHTFHKIQNFSATNNSDFLFNFPTLVSRQISLSSFACENIKKTLLDAGVVCIDGLANFLDKNTIAVGAKQYTAKNFIIATGAKLKTSEISGLETVNYLTPNTALKIQRLPKAVLIAGGGSTGCEIASYFASLGSKVIIMERSTRILPREDKEVSDVITDYFKNELGVLIMPKTRVVALEMDGNSKRVIFSTDGQEKMVRIDCVVLATGSEPALDLGLENAGVKYKRSGIIVDKLFATSAKNIFAVGDCLDRKNTSTEICEYEASLLTSNLLQKTKSVPNYSGFIRLTNTFPEVAVVGLNEQDLLARDKKCKKVIVDLKDLPYSQLDMMSYGFIKLIVNKENRLVGATVVSPNAELIIAELSLAVRHRLSLSTLASTPHPTYSLNQAIKVATKKFIK